MGYFLIFDLDIGVKGNLNKENKGKLIEQFKEYNKLHLGFTLKENENKN